MNSYLFSKKIRCNQCGNNFRGKMQRAKKVYICSTYNKNISFCPNRIAVKEDDILYVIEKHILIYGMIKGRDMIGMVDRIEVNEVGYRIYYIDESESIIEQDRFKV